MVHKAFRLKAVQDVKNPVSALCTVGSSKLIIGCSDGSILLWDVSNGGTKLSPKHVCKPKSKAPIQQLIPLPDLNLLLVVFDGVIQQHTISPIIELKKEVPKISGVTMVAAKKDRDRYYAAATVKRQKVYILEYRKEEAGFVQRADRAEYTLPETPKTLVWNAYGIFIGFKKDFGWLNVGTNATRMKEVFAASCIVSMPVTSEVLLIRGQEGVSLNSEADPSRKTALQFQSMPHTLAYTYPFILALGDRSIEVRAFQPLESREQGCDINCQELQLAHPKFISLPNYIDMDQAALQRVATRRPGNEEEDRGIVHTAQPLVYVTSGTQSVQLLEPVPFSEQVEELLSRNKSDDYEAALTLGSLLTADDISEDLMNRVYIMYGFHLFCKNQFLKAMHLFLRGNIDPRCVIKIFGLLPSYVEQRWTPSPEHARCIQEAQKALSEVQEKLKAIAQLKSWLKNLRQSPTQAEMQDDPLKLDTTEAGMKQASVDTALLRALLLTSEHDVAPFLELPNRCVLEDCESFLREDSKWGDIVALYKSKRLDRKALELLKDLGEGTKSRDPKARELGINGTIAYIQKLDPANATHRELILEYSEWVLLRAPHHQALPMFYSNPKKVITPRLVYEHLRKVLPRNLECQAGYLAKMLEDPILKALPECRNSSIHEALIDVYVALVKKYNGCGKVKDAEAIKARLQSFLKTSERYDPESVKQQFAGEDFYREMTIVHCKLEQHEDALRILAHKLNSFDECVAYCQNESVAKPPPSAAAPSAAPTSALAKGREKRQELHFILFTLLLNPDDKSPPKVEQALRLLNLYPDKVNCLKALKMLPADTKVHDVAQWIVQVLKDVSVKNRETKIYMNLCKSEHHQVAVQRVYRLREKFVIDQKTVCPVCKRKIGNSIVAYYPNGKLVHKICATSLLVCPVTKKTFSPLDELGPKN
ncbi:Vacuolar morphogenesis protein 6 [Diplonema papillatum]|nr:Vacuolar morphogenesis protein 6 [Diplonema papillatum]